MEHRLSVMRACPRCGSSYTKELERCGLDGEPLVDASSDPLLGRTIDRYRVLSPLGEGGMATVYLANHIYLEHECAIKVLKGEVACDRALARRFQREAQASSRIQHPNVVQIIDFGQTKDGLIFMAMELIRGRSLSELLQEEGALPPARAAYFARQLAEGLSAAHALGFVHRDLKPKNVMVSGSPGRELAKILDFGLVLFVDAAKNDSTSLTRQGQIFGTPAYMAPEQVLGQEITTRTDLYALGVMIYQMLSGNVPFNGPSPQVAMHQVATEPPPLADYDGLGAIAMQCMAKRSLERPESAQALIAMIDALGFAPGRPFVPTPAPSPFPHVAIERAIELDDEAPPEMRPLDLGPPVRTPVPVVALPPELSLEMRRGISVSSDLPDLQMEHALTSLPNLELSLGIDEHTPPFDDSRELGAALEEAAIGSRKRFRPWAMGAIAAAAIALGATYLKVVPAAAPANAVASSTPVPAVDPKPVEQKPVEPPKPVVPPRLEPAPAIEAREEPRREPKVEAKVEPKVEPRTEKPPRTKTHETAHVDESDAPADRATFEQRDKALAWTLSRRGLNQRDLTAAMPDGMEQWVLWRIGAEQPGTAALERLSSDLVHAADAIVIDKRLLEAKLDRARAALDAIPEAKRGARFEALRGRYATLARNEARSSTQEAWKQLAAELTLLEGDAIIAGREPDPAGAPVVSNSANTPDPHDEMPAWDDNESSKPAQTETASAAP